MIRSHARLGVLILAVLVALITTSCVAANDTTRSHRNASAAAAGIERRQRCVECEVLQLSAVDVLRPMAHDWRMFTTFLELMDNADRRFGDREERIRELYGTLSQFMQCTPWDEILRQQFTRDELRDHLRGCVCRQFRTAIVSTVRSTHRCAMDSADVGELPGLYLTFGRWISLRWRLVLGLRQGDRHVLEQHDDYFQRCYVDFFERAARELTLTPKAHDNVAKDTVRDEAAVAAPSSPREESSSTWSLFLSWLWPGPWLVLGIVMMWYRRLLRTPRRLALPLAPTAASTTSPSTNAPDSVSPTATGTRSGLVQPD